jgi:signal transduction histidine kinase
MQAETRFQRKGRGVGCGPSFPVSSLDARSIRTIQQRCLRKLWNSSRDVFLIFGRDLILLDINRAALARLKKRKKEIVGRHVLEIFPHLDNSDCRQKYQKVMRTGKSSALKEFSPPSGPGACFALNAFSVGGGLGIVGRDISGDLRAKSELKASIGRLESLNAHNQALREEESKKIAREIHDEMSPILSALKMDLFRLREKWKNGSDPDPSIPVRIAEMIDLTDRSIASVRRICSELRPAVLDDLGLIEAIEWQVEESRKRSPLRCRLHLDGDGLTFDSDLSLCIFRIFQEGFTNILRHAQATRATVSFGRSPSSRALELKIRDNGRGIRPEEISDPRSFGLIGMHDRLRPFNGRMTIRGVPGKGTSLKVIIPSPDQPAAPGPRPR